MSAWQDMNAQLLARVLLRLPFYTRMRCACVCRGWRHACLAGSVWGDAIIRLPAPAKDAGAWLRGVQAWHQRLHSNRHPPPAALHRITIFGWLGEASLVHRLVQAPFLGHVRQLHIADVTGVLSGDALARAMPLLLELKLHRVIVDTLAAMHTLSDVDVGDDVSFSAAASGPSGVLGTCMPPFVSRLRARHPVHGRHDHITMFVATACSRNQWTVMPPDLPSLQVLVVEVHDMSHRLAQAHVAHVRWHDARALPHLRRVLLAAPPPWRLNLERWCIPGSLLALGLRPPWARACRAARTHEVYHL
jgi:hypothetical protein